MMREEIELTMESSWEKAFEFLIAEHFKEEEVEEFLREQGIADLWSYQGLLEFLQEPFVQERLEKQWSHEVQEDWGERPAKVALSETIAQAMTRLILDINMDKKGLFPGRSSGELERDSLRADLLHLFFTQSLKTVPEEE